MGRTRAVLWSHWYIQSFQGCSLTLHPSPGSVQFRPAYQVLLKSLSVSWSLSVWAKFMAGWQVNPSSRIIITEELLVWRLQDLLSCESHRNNLRNPPPDPDSLINKDVNKNLLWLSGLYVFFKDLINRVSGKHKYPDQVWSDWFWVTESLWVLQARFYKDRTMQQDFIQILLIQNFILIPGSIIRYKGINQVKILVSFSRSRSENSLTRFWAHVKATWHTAIRLLIQV